jgi:hypothetical protein
MKKSPFSEPEIARLEYWLDEVDRLPATERREGRELGPIRARTTLLYAPGKPVSTIYASLVRGEIGESLVEARNLVTTTDERPFHFDVDPARPELKRAYQRTLVLALLLAPVFVLMMRRYRQDMKTAVPYTLVVCLTGLGYLLIEIVLIQRYEILLGSPVATFATVLGTLLVFSGLGSLASGRMGPRGVYTAGGSTPRLPSSCSCSPCTSSGIRRSCLPPASAAWRPRLRSRSCPSPRLDSSWACRSPLC